MTKICFLCNQEIKFTDNVVQGKQSGDPLHADCYTKWLKSKLKVKDRWK